MKADFVLMNGPIYSGIHRKPFRFLAVSGNRVQALGRGSGKQYMGRHTNVLDLKGKSVIPGFIDSHLHFLDYAWSLERINLEGASNQQEVLAKLRERATRSVAGEWIRGRGWLTSHFNGFPHKKLLDEIFPETPVALNSRDGHFIWVNSKALELAGLHPMVSVPGGYVGIDAAGSLNGILGENAVDLITRHIPAPDASSRKASLLAAQKTLQEMGVVGLHSTDGNQAFGDLQELHRDAKLRLRIFHSIPFHQIQDAIRISLKTGFGDSWLRFGFVKIFSDGTLGSQTAWMLEPYATGGTGIETIGELELTEAIRLALQNGIAVGVHAIGDRANRQALNAFEANQSQLKIPNALSRIEHVQLLHPVDIPRFARIGIAASMQPYHAISDYDYAKRYWGDRAKYSYAWRSLLESGATMIFGTDAPIESPDPLPSIQAAVHRQNWDNREQRIPAFEALQAYTYCPAVASGEQKNRGSLEAGKLADFVILSADPFPSSFLDAKVVGTVIGGEFVYRDFQ